MYLISIQSFIQGLLKADKSVFLSINKNYTNSFFDALMPVLRNSNTWVPLYVLILFVAIKQYKKQVWLWLLFAIATVVITDQFSSHLIKPFVQRLRPCADPDFSTQIRLLLKHCSGGYSFTSSHATNHFGIAVFFIITLAGILKKWRWLFIFWAACIGYAQVYVGVHYPLDVFCGSLLGVILGYTTATLYKKAATKIYTS